MKNVRSMLLVTHECTLTGAPMNLLHFVRWLRANTSIRLEVLALSGGPLVERFEAVCPVTVLDTGPHHQALKFAQLGLLQLGSRRAWRPFAAARLTPQLRSIGEFDVIYLNSATSVSVLPFLPKPGLVVSHVHELDVAFAGWRPATDLDAFATLPDLWIAASTAVETMLVDRMGFPADRVETHFEYIDVPSITDRPVSLANRERLLRSIEFEGAPVIPIDASIVMGSGTIDWRKGTDLFVQLAAEVARRSTDPIWFVWVGGDHGGHDMQRLLADIRRSGVHRVRFIEPQQDPFPWFAIADVFALTSREDPFPLVCLEQAAMGTPVVAYRSGGIHELLDAAGPAAARGNVDYLDVGTFAERTLAFLDDVTLREAAGRELRERVTSHHDVPVVAPQVMEAIERRFAERSVSR